MYQKMSSAEIIALHYRRIKYRNEQRGPRTDCSYVDPEQTAPLGAV